MGDGGVSGALRRVTAAGAALSAVVVCRPVGNAARQWVRTRQTCTEGDSDV